VKSLVTGATGFIGSNLVRYLCSQDYDVRAMVRATSDISELEDLPVDICHGEVRDPSLVQKAVKGCDFVFHLAGYAKSWARDCKIFQEVNVIGTENVLNACRRADVKKVVMTSTSMTFGPSDGETRNESGKRTENFFCDYERTKFYAEQLAERFVKAGLPIVIVHPTRVFGPGLLSEANSVTRMIQLYLKRKWRLILADGNAVGNYAFIEDVVLGHWLALQKGRPGEKYILGGESLTYNRFFEILAKLSDRHYRMIHVPAWMALAFSRIEDLLAHGIGIYPLITPQWVRIFIKDWDFTSRKAEKELGYRITPFEEALRKTLNWIDRNRYTLKVQ
jgi:nucleoside-diphosphate-sugar epimerase